MTGEKYKDVDVPFCCACSRFMVIYIGKVKVYLNHETDPVYIERDGDAFKCPQCGHIVIFKWTNTYTDIEPETTKLYKYWYMFLEDHTHYNKKRGKK